MAARAASSLQIATRRPVIPSSCKVLKAGSNIVSVNLGNTSWDKLTSTRHLSNLGSLRNHSPVPTSRRPVSFCTKAMSESSETKASSGLPIDLRGKRAFIAGIADDNGYGWAIVKSLAAAGAEILVGTWVPALDIF